MDANVDLRVDTISDAAYRFIMKTIDYIYRFDPKNPSVKPPPEDAEVARRHLDDGNQLFSEWMESCRTGTFSKGKPRYVVRSQ